MRLEMKGSVVAQYRNPKANLEEARTELASINTNVQSWGKYKELWNPLRKL